MRVGQHSRRLAYLFVAASAAALVAGCNEQSVGGAKALRPIPSETLALMSQKGTTRSAPVLIRTFKKEAELEIWKMKADGTYVHLKTYPMCRWSGQLGPKTREGDRQVPEGFYTITQRQMNPNSSYYLSFDVGYPNAYDRSFGRTGGDIMVHGDCSSRGCFSMTDKQIAEIYAIAREAFSGGQRGIQMQSLPFRMTGQNLAQYRFDPNIRFWKELKKGADAFEVTKQEPQVGVCGKRYVFNSTPAGTARLDATSACPPLIEDEKVKSLVAAKESKDEQDVAELIAKGVKPIRTVYADGGQHPDFKHIDMVSRPDALAQAPQEIEIDERGKPVKSPVLQVAAAKAMTPVVAAASVPATAANAVATAVAAPIASAAKTNAQAAPVAAKVDTVAKAAPAAVSEQPKAEPAQASGQPFYKKWLPTFGQAEEPKVEAVEQAAPQPSSSPLPPRRASAKPQAAKPAKPEQQRVSQKLPEVITGAAQPLPPGFRSYAPL